MGEFWRYLETVPMRDYPWWGLALVFVLPLGLGAAYLGPIWWRTRRRP
jgi:hypothetical protein